MPVVALEDLPTALPPRTPLFGLDLGEKTIGVAVSDATRLIASPLVLIRKAKFTDDANRLLALMKERSAQGVVIGLPVNMDGTEGPRCQSVRAFGRNLLRIEADIAVAFWDERLSSAAVNRMLIGEADVSRARRGELVDKAAAAWILQGALDRLGALPFRSERDPWRGGQSGLERGLMTAVAPGLDDVRSRTFPFPRRHFISAADLTRPEAVELLDLADGFVALNRLKAKKLDLLKGRTLMNLFFENSTRTQSSFELAGKRLGADVVNMSPRSSSMSKGETLIDTAVTLNAMRPDLLTVRHASSGAASLLAQKVDCSVINAGDGQHEHPTQALLDALSMRRAFGGVEGLTVAICGDVKHSRVARSNVILLQLLGANVRLVGPPTLMPSAARRWGCQVFHDMREGIADVQVVMMLRLQLERMTGALVPSTREYFRFFGLDRERLACAAPDARVMHPGPMNRGVEIDSDIADDLSISLIQDQVEMGVAVRMAVLASLAARLENDR